MDLAAFETWLDGIAALTEAQRRRAWQGLALAEAADSGDDETVGLLEENASQLDRVSDETRPAMSPAQAGRAHPVDTPSIAALGQRRVDRVGCPHCDSRDVVRWGAASALPRYRCKACRRTFNALTKTPLANLRMKDKWAAQTEALIEGVTTAKAARRCGVHYTTAFRWRHRFLASLAGDKPKALAGIVEGDETFILESFKGKRADMPRKSRKRGGKSAKRGLSAEQIPIIVARDRQGATTDAGTAEIESRVDCCGVGRRRHACQRVLLRRWHGDCGFRTPGGDCGTHPADARQTKSKGARFSPQQRQCIPWTTEGVAAPLPWRRNEKPVELSRLAADPGGLGTERNVDRHDPRGDRNGTLPTNDAIRAKKIDRLLSIYPDFRRIRKTPLPSVPTRILPSA